MENRINKKTSALGLAVVVLFIVAVLTFPYAFNLSWALPGASSDRTLTYAPGTLTWDSKAEIDSQGVAKLHIFKDSYDGSSAVSTDGANIVAPNTQGSENLRVVNTAGYDVQYCATLYRIDQSKANIEAEVAGGAQTTDYLLPDGVTQDQVEYAIGGTITANATQIMAVDWVWPYYTSEANDVTDTAAGDDTEINEVTYGLYVVVYDTEIDPEPTPDNGNNANNENANNENANDNTNGNSNTSNINNIIDNINNTANEIEDDINNAKNNINRNRNTWSNTTSGTWPSTWNTNSGSNKNYNTNTSGKVVTPTTGDNSRAALLFALAVACMCALFATVIFDPSRKKRKGNKKKNMHET